MNDQEFNIAQYLQLLRRHPFFFVVVALAIMTATILISYLLPKRYEAKSTVFIEKSVIADLVKGIAVTASIDDKLKVLNYSLTSRTLLVKVIDELDMNLKKTSDAELEALIKKIQKNMVVKQKERENLFSITFKNENPRLARDFVNTLVRRYIEENTSAKRQDSYGATEFLSEQLKTFKEKLDKAENDVNTFKRNKGSMVSIEPASLQQEINAAQQRLDDIRIRRSQLETHLASLKKISPLQAKLSALQKQLEELRAQFTDSYPEIRRIKAEIDAIQAQMRGEVKTGLPEQMEQDKAASEIRALKQAEDNLRSIIATNRGLLQGIPATRAQLEDLEREKNAQKAQYEMMLARHGQSEVSKQLEVQDKTSNYRIVDPAVMPIKPVSPNRLRIMAMGIVGGIAGAFGLLLLMDFLDKSVKTVDTLKGIGYPVLVTIPSVPDEAKERKHHRKLVRLAIFGSLYLLLLLCFPIMEVLELDYVDRALTVLRHG
jgi:polysaccharide chain length determinant protein (PEP-CTERM system associated)